MSDGLFLFGQTNDSKWFTNNEIYEMVTVYKYECLNGITALRITYKREIKIVFNKKKSGDAKCSLRKVGNMSFQPCEKIIRAKWVPCKQVNVPYMQIT